MLLTFTPEARHAYRSKARRIWTPRLDPAGDPWLHRLVAAWARGAGFHDRERTHGLLEPPITRTLAGQDGPNAGPNGTHARTYGRHGRRPGLVGPTALERQSRFRRVPDRNAASARGGATRVSRIPSAPALRKGQDRVRSIHGRASQSTVPAPFAGAARLGGVPSLSTTEPFGAPTP